MSTFCILDSTSLQFCHEWSFTNLNQTKKWYELFCICRHRHEFTRPHPNKLSGRNFKAEYRPLEKKWRWKWSCLVVKCHESWSWGKGKWGMGSLGCVGGTVTQMGIPTRDKMFRNFFHGKLPLPSQGPAFSSHLLAPNASPKTRSIPLNTKN